MRKTLQGWRTGIGGGVALTFALMLPLLTLAVGGGIDLSNALSYRQKLASALELGCQQSALEINYEISQGTPATTNFAPVVNKIVAQKISDAALDGSPSATSTAAATKITLNGKGSSAAFFAQVLNQFGPVVNTTAAGTGSFPIAVQRQCSYLQANQAPPPGQTLFSESFEVNHTVAQNSWSVLGYNGTKTSGGSWNGWSTLNAGIEINGEPQLSGGTIRFGDFFAELDSDCLGASPCHSNSTMYRIVNLQPGTYEVSYWYISRVTDVNRANYGIGPASGYGSVVHCGQPTDPLVTNATWDDQTNRIELYVEKAGSYTYSPSNEVDVCVYSDHWIERDYYFTVTSPTPVDYRISWRAAGKEDTFGGLIDYLRLCKGTCP